MGLNLSRNRKKSDTSVTYITPVDGNIFAGLNFGYPEILLNQADNKVRPSVTLSENAEAVRLIVLSNRATNPCVFGSALHGTDTYKSDLNKLLGVYVNAQTPNSLPHNLRYQVLLEAKAI